MTAECKCCGVVNVIGKPFSFHGVYLWANQYGYKRRFFCHVCGCVWEHTQMPGYVSDQHIGNWATIYKDEPSNTEQVDDLPF